MIEVAGVPGRAVLAAGEFSSLQSIPAGAVVVIAVLGVLELALDVVALVILVRTPKERVTLPKWGWALLIILINTLGSILFLALGRRPAVAVAPAPPPPGAVGRPSASSVADSLYGDPGRDDPNPSDPDRGDES